jgi:hypothetical protein
VKNNSGRGDGKESGGGIGLHCAAFWRDSGNDSMAWQGMNRDSKCTVYFYQAFD